MAKTYWRERNDVLDAELDAAQIYRNLMLYEFPWDLNQALSLALFRTYAVPTIGRLLDETSEFGERVQKRYDDTVLLLEAPMACGFASTEGRTAMRRINQMHQMYDISQDDFRYVLATFVVTPKRWLDDYGWRPLTEHEVTASVHYYRTLGHQMAIRDIPATFAAFETFLDDYERQHFAHDEGGRRVADATMRLLASFYPAPARPLLDVVSRALMDEALIAAFGYRDPGPRTRAVVTAALRARATLLAHVPSRRRPRFASDTPRIRSYPDGYDLADLGTFTPGCPVGAGRARAKDSPRQR